VPVPIGGQHSIGYGFGGVGMGYGSFGYGFGYGLGFRYPYGYRYGAGHGWARPWGGPCRPQWVQCARSFCCRKRSRRRFFLALNIGGFFGLNIAQF
jgi:hypothetical protein